MYLVASVCPSVRPSVCQQRAKKGHYQSEEFVCVSNNRADAVDLLLILAMLASIFMIFNIAHLYFALKLYIPSSR